MKALEEMLEMHRRETKVLRETEEKYRRMFENVQDLFYQVNFDGIILHISPSVVRYSGYTREVIPGRLHNDRKDHS